MLRLKLADSTHCGVISEIIGKSFKKQAELLAVKKEEYPNFVAFETVEGVQNRIKNGDHIVLAYFQGKPVGTISYKVDSAQSDKGYVKLGYIPQEKKYFPSLPFCLELLHRTKYR